MASLSPTLAITRKDAVARDIKRAIVTGVLAPGQRITELDLSAQLQVSRPTVREALAQLTRDAVLVQEPYKGMRVASASAADIMQLAVLRESLDLMALDLIYAQPDEHGIDEVLNAWHQFERMEEDPDPLARHEAHILFHHRVWQAAGSDVVMAIAPVVEGLMTVVLARDLQVRPDRARGHSLHQQYVNAIASRDLALAQRAVHEHTVGTAAELVTLVCA